MYSADSDTVLGGLSLYEVLSPTEDAMRFSSYVSFPEMQFKSSKAC